MKTDSMIDLVKMYDAISKVEDVQKILFGTSVSSGMDDGIFGTMTRVESIIRRECNPSLVNDDRSDLSENEYYVILTNGMPAEERAELLVHGTHVPGYKTKESLQIGDRLKLKRGTRCTKFIIISIQGEFIYTDDGIIELKNVPDMFYYVTKDKKYIDIV